MKTKVLHKWITLWVKTIVVFTLMLASNINAQTTLDSTHLITEFSVNAKFVQADELGNLYIVSPSNQLYKYNTSGKVLATLNYNYNGNISSIDASNPMEIYVFYKELNRVLFLDNNLAYRGELDLTKQNITQAAAIARSYDNGIWVFDMGDLQLKKMSKDGTVAQLSGNIKQIIKSNFVPTTILENTKQVAITSDSICLFFDVFASYIRTKKVSANAGLQLGNQYLFETNANQINGIDLNLGNTIPFLKIQNLTQTIKWSFVNKNNVYLWLDDKIKIFATN
jgi:hypothetical protein